VCSVSASSPTPTVGTNVTLTASCNGAPTSYVWTNCAGNTSSCTTSSASAGPATYTVAGVNQFGTGTPASVTVNWTANPPVCSVSASNSTPIVGNNITLTASCSGAPTSYIWTNCSSTASTCITTSANTGAATYTVAGVNTFGTSPAASVSVNWQALGSGGQDFCPSYKNVVKFSVPWGDSNRYLTKSIGGFAADGVIVMEFTVPAGPASYAVPGVTNMAEYGEPATARQMTLSKSSCDFRGTDPSGNNGPYAVSNGNQVGISFNVGVQPAALVPGQTYYMNFRNWSVDLGGPSCGAGTCNAGIITIPWPH